jgi:hypothetical protein
MKKAYTVLWSSSRSPGDTKPRRTVITEGKRALALIKTHVIIGPAKYTVKLQEILVMNIRH